jgi:hypothetical protein
VVVYWSVMPCLLVFGYQGFSPEEKGSMFLLKVCTGLQVHKATQPRRPPCTENLNLTFPSLRDVRLWHCNDRVSVCPSPAMIFAPVDGFS